MTNSKLKQSKKQKTIGIFGGGQLGQMTCHAAKKMGYKTIVFSDIDDCPSKTAADEMIIAKYEDESALKEFANKCDVITLEFENIPVKSANFVNHITPIYPQSHILQITQNRIKEKDFLTNNQIKTTNYCKITSLSQLKSSLEKFDHKAILKTATMGYDGKGQYVLDQNSNLDEIYQINQNNQLILEKFSDFQQEISVICARNINKEISCFEPLTNIHKNGILDQSIYPAKINDQIKNNSQEIASKIANLLNLVGLITIEFFVLKNGQLLVNELAPRPHNSGHFSMDGCDTSQFMQLINAITNQNFTSTTYRSQGYMKNLIGDEISHIKKYQSNKNAKIHLYGKKEIKAGRKMGHINIIL